MKKALTLLPTLIIGFAASVWTGTGESSDPVLADREIPAAIASTCALTPAGEIEACDHPTFSRRWVAKTVRGDLFIVTHERCTGSDCRAGWWRKPPAPRPRCSASTPLSACAKTRAVTR